ncbi:MAG TPA: competence protein ComEA [Kandleria vitulina]|nr:competence protein ComEA [Kandleria vitulina]
MKKIKFIAFILLSIVSMIYSYRQPAKMDQTQEKALYITLEGAFKKTGDFAIKEGMTMKDVIKEVGIKKNANIDTLPLERSVTAEQTIYLPYKRNGLISLNHGTKEDFKKLSGVGEKMAQRIIDYRKKNRFNWIEDLMNVPGIGEKRFLNYRDYICL